MRGIGVNSRFSAEAGHDVAKWCPVPVPFAVDVDAGVEGDVVYARGPAVETGCDGTGAGRDMPGENRNGMPDPPAALAKGNVDAGACACTCAICTCCAYSCLSVSESANTTQHTTSDHNLKERCTKSWLMSKTHQSRNRR
jgi:hypothetical protein